MATQAAYQEQQNALSGLVQSWDRRWRARQTLLWLPRSIIPGIVIGLIFLLISRARPWLVNQQIVSITAAAVLAGMLIMMLAVWLWPRPLIQNARRFDLLFNLGERTSTALELIEGRIRTNEELRAFQLEDAWEKARTVRAADHIPMLWERRSWIAAGVLFGLWLLLLLLPNPQAEAIDRSSAREVAIAEAAEELRRITAEVAADTSLTEEERSQLLQQLERTTDTLDEPDAQTEEAMAALSDAESELRQQSEQIQQSADAQRSAMEQAAEALRNLESIPEDSEAAQAAAQGDPIPTIAQLQQSMENMSQTEQMDAAAALEQAAQALEQTNPEAAQALREAAEALRQGDLQAAQEALQRAQESMQEGQQESQQQADSAQNLNQSAQQLQRAQQQIGQQQGQPQNSSDGLQQLQQLNQPSNQQQPPGQQPSQSETQGQQQGESGGEGQQPGESGEQPGSQEGGMPSSMQQQGQPSSTEGQPSSEPSTGGGAGDGQGDAGSDQAQSGSQLTAQQDNDPDGGGEGQMPLVYAPQRIGGESDQQIFLEPDASGVPATEGEFSENPAGQSLVPYNQVFSDYRSAANRALESDYIPLGLRDVVRDYFTSLEPGQNQGDQ